MQLPAGAQTWAEVLAPVAGDSSPTRSLAVNYRTPAEIMEAAALVLPEDKRHRVPQAVRRSGKPPRHSDLPEIRDVVTNELGGSGTIAVIMTTPADLPDLPVPVHTPPRRRAWSSM